MKTKTIILSDLFAKHISSRASVMNLFKLNFDKVNLLRIDFTHIEFISRSAAHQFLQEKKRLKREYNLSLEFENVNAMLNQLFTTVKQSPNSGNTAKKVKSLGFTTTSDLSKFLQTV